MLVICRKAKQNAAALANPVWAATCETDLPLRRVHPQIPSKVEYEISPFGQSLGPILLSLRSWGEQYRGAVEGYLEQSPRDEPQTWIRCSA